MNPGHFCDGVTTTRPPKPFGVEIRGVYDGALFWACPACEFAWHRFGEDHPLRARAEGHLASWNTKRQLDAMVREAAELGLYEATAEPRETR